MLWCVPGDLQRAVGRNVRRVRRSRGVSQETLATQVSLHRTYVGAVERGERNLTLQTVERLAEQLGVHPLELLVDADGATFDSDGRLVLNLPHVEQPLVAADGALPGAVPRGTVVSRRARPSPD